MNSKFDEVKRMCAETSLHCLGTSYVFQKKAEKYAKRLRFINVTGLLTPLFVGLVVLGYGIDSTVLKIVFPIAVTVSLLQGVLSGIAIVNKWESILSYSVESQTANRELYQKLREILSLAVDEQDFYFKWELLKKEDNERTKQDEKYAFSDKENRIGMRYALYILQRECAVCHKRPVSMTPSDCNTCGNF